MSKYIEAEAIKMGKHPIIVNDFTKGWNYAIDAIVENAPAADVVEVRRIGNELFIDFPNCAEIKEITLSHKGVGCSFVEENTDRELHYGRWIKREYCSNYSGYDYGMRCSVCGKPLYRQLSEKMPPYCPNCGSRMMDEVAK